MTVPFALTGDGFETQFQTNYLAPHLLTASLLPVLLATARAALRPGGLLAIWSAAPDPGFTRALKSAGFRVDEETVRARSNGKGPRHHLWFAAR